MAQRVLGRAAPGAIGSGGLPPGHHLRRYRFSLKRNPVQQHTISKEATENVWLDSVRSTIQQWTDVNRSVTEADKMSQ